MSAFLAAAQLMDLVNYIAASTSIDVGPCLLRAQSRHSLRCEPMSVGRTFQPFARIIPTGASGPLRSSTQIADAALQPVEADPVRRRSTFGRLNDGCAGLSGPLQ